jgi:hypothetical protein
MKLIAREADEHTWTVVDRILAKSKDPEAKAALEFLKATENKFKREWDLHCRNFGLKPEHFGTTFRSGRAIFRIAELKPNSYKYPIIAVNERGARYKFPASVIISNPAIISK